MAENSWPFENQDTTELQWSKIFQLLAGTGTLDGLTLSTAGGMSLSLSAGSAFIRGFFYENTDAKTLTIPAADTTPRKDYVVRRLDLGANVITTEVLKGTANSGGGTLPALTQTPTLWEEAVGIITVPANAVNLVAANVQLVQEFAPITVWPYSGSAPDLANERTPALAVDLGNGDLSLNTGNGWTLIRAATTIGSIQGATTLGKQLLGVTSLAELQHLVGIWVQNTDPGTLPAGNLWFKEA